MARPYGMTIGGLRKDRFWLAAQCIHDCLNSLCILRAFRQFLLRALLQRAIPRFTECFFLHRLASVDHHFLMVAECKECGMSLTLKKACPCSPSNNASRSAVASWRCSFTQNSKESATSASGDELSTNLNKIKIEYSFNMRGANQWTESAYLTDLTLQF